MLRSNSTHTHMTEPFGKHTPTTAPITLRARIAPPDSANCYLFLVKRSAAASNDTTALSQLSRILGCEIFRVALSYTNNE
jgi:mannitol/fructose-specific phosphotransferase system IIA component (Ntr-type)